MQTFVTFQRVGDAFSQSLSLARGGLEQAKNIFSAHRLRTASMRKCRRLVPARGCDFNLFEGYT